MAWASSIYKIGDKVAINPDSFWAKRYGNWDEWQDLIVIDIWDDGGYWYKVEYKVAVGNALMSSTITVPEEALCRATRQHSANNALYCTCENPQRYHNMGIGTLDFWVCKKCKREIK